MASAPLLAKKVFLSAPGVICAIRSARLAAGMRVVEVGGAVDKLLHLRLAAAITSGLQCPALATEMPAKQSSILCRPRL